VIGVVSVNVFVNAPVDVDVNLNVNPHEIASPWSPIDDERVDFVDAARSRCTLHDDGHGSDPVDDHDHGHEGENPANGNPGQAADRSAQ